MHISVDDLYANVRFYSAMFGVPPAVLKPDYAKWMLDDPRINFAISSRGVKPGVDHLGVEVDSESELTALREQAAAAKIARLDQASAECCYARSDKYWTADPQGIPWKLFTPSTPSRFTAKRDYKLGKRLALEWFLFAIKEKVINLLMRVTTGSV